MYRVYGSIFVPDDIVVTPFNVSFFTNVVTTNDNGFRCVFDSRYSIENRWFEIEGTSNKPDVIVTLDVQKNRQNEGTRVCVRCYEIRPDYSQKFKEDSIVLNYHANDSQFVLNREINIL
jgi:hypothetical protein